MANVKEKLKRNLSLLKESVRNDMTSQTIVENFGENIKNLKEDNLASAKLFEALLEDNKMSSELIEGILQENEETQNDIKNIEDILDRLITFLIDLKQGNDSEEIPEEVPEEVPEPSEDENEEVKENTNNSNDNNSVSEPAAPKAPVQTESGFRGSNQQLKEVFGRRVQKEKSLSKLF